MPKKKIDEPKPKRRFQHMISTAVKETECSVCRTPVWSAYDGGLIVKAEKSELTPQEEIVVLFAGRQTITFQRWGGLHLRDAHEIAAGLRPGETVHPRHYCNGKAR